MTDTPLKKIFISGATGWIGHYLTEYISATRPDIEVVGIGRSSATDSAHQISMWKPSVFVNLSRGETDSDFELHEACIREIENLGGYYLYASSFNACDNQLTAHHFESELPNAQSPYGKFKARCEFSLTSKASKYGIVRFSATHGWAPNRIARTEEFLQKMRRGETVHTAQGIVQNRTYVGDLAGMIGDIALARVNGLFNLGTEDFSEEATFLKSLAAAFGYPERLVTVSGSSPTNAVMVPEKIFTLFGDKWRRTESQTIASIANTPQLQKYMEHQ